MPSTTSLSHLYRTPQVPLGVTTQELERDQAWRQERQVQKRVLMERGPCLACPTNLEVPSLDMGLEHHTEQESGHGAELLLDQEKVPGLQQQVQVPSEQPGCCQ